MTSNLRSKLAFWTPIPPADSTYAANAATLANAFSDQLDVTVVIRDGAPKPASVDRRFSFVHFSEYRSEDFDLNIYHVANSASAHGYLIAQAVREPGMLLLSEPNLYETYAEICGSTKSFILDEEVRFNRTSPHQDLAAAGSKVTDARNLPMCRRLVEASILTCVTTHWACTELQRQYPESDVIPVPRLVYVGSEAGPRRETSRPGVIGAVGFPGGDREMTLLIRAFADVSSEYIDARLVISAATPEMVARLEQSIRQYAPNRMVTVNETGSSLSLSNLVHEAGVVFALGLAESGGIHPLIDQLVADGRRVVLADAPQYREIEGELCTLLGGDPQSLQSAIADTIRATLENPRASVEQAEHSGLQTPNESIVDRALDNYLDAINRCISKRRTISTKRRPLDTSAWLPIGVNAIASWEATTGLAEAARRSVDALVAAGVGVAMEDYDYGAPRLRERFPERLRSLPTGRPHDIDICYLNVNELHAMTEVELRPWGRRHHLIGYWYWELPFVPWQLREQIDRVDEVWVASEFVAEAFRGCTTKPVKVVPCVVEPKADPLLNRSDFGLPDGPVLFMYHFDANSTVARKNPRAVIRAFEMAFRPEERGRLAHLIMKTINLSERAEANQVLRQDMARVGGTVLDADLTVEKMSALVAACDVYVSLHRAEGFGLGMAEAMYFAKPTIGTAYSGNMDFMNSSNSCLIGYKMTTVGMMDLRFNPGFERVYKLGSPWADPDVSDAAKWMRYLALDPGVRKRIGARARATILEQCSQAAVGNRMRELLERPGRRSLSA